MSIFVVLKTEAKPRFFLTQRSEGEVSNLLRKWGRINNLYCNVVIVGFICYS